MVRLLYTWAALAILGAGILLNVCVRQWYGDDSQLARLRSRPGAVQLFKDRVLEGRDEATGQTSPLVAQAQVFAAYVNPAPPVESEQAPAVPEVVRNDPAPAVRPKASLVAFTLHGTSCYPDQPERSMALISEPGGSKGDGKWVKEGSALGHFVVQEIRRGVVIVRDGQARRELTVDHRPPVRSLVRSYTASVAQADAGESPTRTGADSNTLPGPRAR